VAIEFSETFMIIDVFVYNWQQGERPTVAEGNDLTLTLGSLWGEQLVLVENCEMVPV
jgi:hypothetical protein